MLRSLHRQLSVRRHSCLIGSAARGRIWDSADWQLAGLQEEEAVFSQDVSEKEMEQVTGGEGVILQKEEQEGVKDSLNQDKEAARRRCTF